MAKKLYVSNAKKVDLSSLKGVVEEFVIKKTDDCDSSNLKFVNGVAEVKEVGCCLLSSLETVKDLIASEKDIKAKYFAYPDEFIKHGTTSEIEKEFKLSAEEISRQIWQLAKMSVPLA